jgi:hypothetical protein
MRTWSSSARGAGIKCKSFTSSVRLTDKQVTGTSFMTTFLRDCERISPLMAFLASARRRPLVARSSSAVRPRAATPMSSAVRLRLGFESIERG